VNIGFFFVLLDKLLGGCHRSYLKLKEAFQLTGALPTHSLQNIFGLRLSLQFSIKILECVEKRK
jgi:hypothetical protein